MPPAIRVENLSKQYRLGQVGTGTLSHDLNRFWAQVRGKPDPYSTVGVVNDRASKAVETSGDYVWALKDVNFSVEPGEIVGIIGKNGAGKSTLLKLLSRVTAPTTGSIELHGRVASLLEVGTGFHPELSGRENIFLNGAILGMTKAETKARFDDIVDFSGCAKYVDTPVKRYSSGMYVRLAFAVAAHLDPEILIVDEVLAVGDAEFQNRCIGKMREVSRRSGRTVLFVSHNMGSIRSLCDRGILIRQGGIASDGTVASTIADYVADGAMARVLGPGSGVSFETDEIRVIGIRVMDETGSVTSILTSDSAVTVEVEYQLKVPIRNLRLCLLLKSGDGIEIAYTSDFSLRQETGGQSPGAYRTTCTIPGHFLNRGRYLLNLAFDVPREREVLAFGADLSFEISELTQNYMGITLAPQPAGLIHPRFTWTCIEAA